MQRSLQAFYWRCYCRVKNVYLLLRLKSGTPVECTKHWTISRPSKSYRPMKKLFSFLLALSTTITAVAHGSERTMLKLRLSDRTQIAVNVDGRYFNRRTTSLTLDGLRPGLHRVEVYSTDGYRARPVRIYTGTIRLEAGTVNIAIVDVYRRALRMRTRPMDAQRDEAYSDNSDREGLGKSGDDDYDDRDHNYPRNDHSDDNKRDDDYRDNGNAGNGNNDRGNGEGYGSFPHGRNNSTSTNTTGDMLTQRDMNNLRARVGKLITDSDKESLMKSELNSRSVSTEQVRAMLRWLSFESTRLGFAKWAYSRVTDRQNYRKLESAFDFSASKKEFNDAIRGR